MHFLRHVRVWLYRFRMSALQCVLLFCLNLLPSSSELTSLPDNTQQQLMMNASISRVLRTDKGVLQLAAEFHLHHPDTQN